VNRLTVVVAIARLKAGSPFFCRTAGNYLRQKGIVLQCGGFRAVSFYMNNTGGFHRSIRNQPENGM
jgi:hypothetical protein